MVTLDERTMSLFTLSMRNAPSSRILPSSQHICYLSRPGQMAASPLYLWSHLANLTSWLFPHLPRNVWVGGHQKSSHRS